MSFILKNTSSISFSTARYMQSQKRIGNTIERVKDQMKESCSTHVTVHIQVSTDVARALHQRGPPTTESQALSEVAKRLGISLKPLHPDVDDPLLSLFFTTEVSDRATAERVIARLQRCKAIQAAYLKPPDEMPREAKLPRTRKEV